MIFKLNQYQLLLLTFLVSNFLFPFFSSSSFAQLNRENFSRLITLRNSQSNFELPEPSISILGEKLTLWSTYYIIHEATTTQGENTFPLLDSNYQSLGIQLSHKDWCDSALQGTVRIFDNNRNYTTYNFDQRGEAEIFNSRDDINTVDCSKFFSSLSETTLEKMSRILFKRVDSPYGDGTDGFILLPYRSIAVDQNLIPLGTVIYIPSARGVEIELPSGEIVKHDGYFFAADIGSAINGNKIDTFIGVNRNNPFSHILSSQTATFEAFIVNDIGIKGILTNVHLP